MPRIKQRSNIPNLSLEQRHEKALEGLEDGTYESLAKAAQANDLSKSSLGHWKTTIGSAPERADLCSSCREGDREVDFKLDDYRFSRRVDILMGLVKHLTKDERNWQVQIRDFAQGKKPPPKNINGKNWIIRFLIWHPISAAKFAGRVDPSTCECQQPPHNQRPL